ncbi:hypothetical protein H2198_001498 [Neophaeococcomyces mojaviensis]|uniref:Uncharacterized protein n=1 Tax=Neophaeococcomyces mojaviensis TaxID=3383035 RepID=A0ACC3AHJ9_9EURO|nr:hypothetical protein H2198_001498 [Knufia sp. JES_112]
MQWPHHRGPLGRATHHNRRALTQLYNDAKISLGDVRNASANSPFDNDPDVVALRKEFQLQQDRLLAWGLHWADKQAGSSGTKSKDAHQDVDIDEKVDQAGLGEVVASIMENIQSTLAQSGQLQHPGRWKEHRGGGSTGGGIWSGMKGSLGREKSRGMSKPAEWEEWKTYELTTGTELLQKLTESIDLLYQLDQTQQDEHATSTTGKEKHAASSTVQTPNPPASLSRHISIDEAFDTSKNQPSQIAQQILNHPLYIDFSRLAPMHDPDAAAEPPSYEEAKENTTTIRERAVYFFPGMQSHVLVDLTRAKSLPIIGQSMSKDDPFRQVHELAQLVSGKGLMTWDGHLKLLGFTLAAANSRFGLVYALPAPNDPTALQTCQTLTTSIKATLENETSIPPLENKFRLAYNIALSVTSYLAHNECHGHIKPSNIVFLRENDNPKLGATLRCPYILHPVHKLVGEPSIVQNLSATIYHHVDADEVGYGVVPAYDIFSVGMILLEIGLWRSLTAFYKPKYDRALFHDRLRKFYLPKLASKCGSRYMRLVQMCLDAPEDLKDKPSPIDAAEYLLEVVEDLSKCCAIDEKGPPSELDIEAYESLIHSQRLDSPQQSKSIASPGPAIRSPPAAVPQPRPTPTKKASTSSKVHKQKPADTLKKWPELDIPQDHLETWNNMLMPRLSKMLKNALQDSMESCSVSLMMIGSTPEKAKTTICVQCRDTARVRETLCHRFKPKSGWGLVVCAGDVRRSGQIRKKRGPNARRSGADTDTIDSKIEKTREQLYQPWPGSGASIGAWTDDQHLPPVSFGGTIIVDGQPYGMTVHHMLDDPDDVEGDNRRAGPDAPKRSTAPRPSANKPAEVEADTRFMGSDEDLPDMLDELDIDDRELADTSDDSDDDYDSDIESDTSTIRPDYSIMDEDGDEFFFLDDDDDDDDEAPDLEDDSGHHSDSSAESEDETGSVGDTCSISPTRFDDEDFCITQPAWDDVPENFFSDDLEDRDYEHLISHSFGLVHASSGLKRIMKGNLKHEIDWALIRINERRLKPDTPVAAAGRKSSSSSKFRKPKSMSGSSSLLAEPPLTAITPLTALPNLRVSSVGRTSGRRSGVISPAMSLLKLPGRKSFSQSFTVEGGMGVPGDSGAWVYSEERRELCGHILAWNNALKVAYIAPMEVMLEDLKARIGAKEVRLPGAAITAPATLQGQISSTSTLEEESKGKESVEPAAARNDGSMERGRRSPKNHVQISHLASTMKALQIDTTHERAKDRRDEQSPVSAASTSASGSGATRRSRAQPDLERDRKKHPQGKDVYEYQCDLRRSAAVTWPIPS